MWILDFVRLLWFPRRGGMISGFGVDFDGGQEFEG
jgi:hypothetical protein